MAVDSNKCDDKTENKTKGNKMFRANTFQFVQYKESGNIIHVKLTSHAFINILYCKSCHIIVFLTRLIRISIYIVTERPDSVTKINDLK